MIEPFSIFLGPEEPKDERWSYLELLPNDFRVGRHHDHSAPLQVGLAPRVAVRLSVVSFTIAEVDGVNFGANRFTMVSPNKRYQHTTPSGKEAAVFFLRSLFRGLQFEAKLSACA